MTASNSGPTTDETAPPETGTHRSNVCPECQGSLSSVDGEVVCDDCGLVVDENRLDHGPEWRSYNASERKRTGAPLTATRHDRGLSTEIGHGTDAGGTPLSERKRRRLGRLRREHQRGQWRTKAERNLAYGLGEVQRIASALDLPETLCEQACVLFRSAQDRDLFQGRSLDAFTAASVYAACRCNGLPRTLDDIEVYIQCDRSSLTNAYKLLNIELDLETQPQQPHEFVPRFASELDLPDHIRREAFDLAKRAENAGLTTGSQPTGVAAACLYLVAQDHGSSLTQTRLAAVADTSTVTIRNHRRKLNGLLE